MTKTKSVLLRVRPAPLAGIIATVCGMNKRRMVLTDSGRFFVDPISNFGERLLDGAFEPHMGTVLDRFLSPGGVFIDLGANEGYFSVLASKIVGSKGSVIAIEPQSRLQDVIQTNLSANECFNVRLLKCIVSDKTANMRIFLAPTTNTGSSSLFRPNKYHLPTQEIQSYALGELLEKIGVDNCDLMKVDIEGAEYDVFMAAAEVLKKGILRNIALEYHPRILMKRGLAPEDLHQHMIENGYGLNKEFGPWVYTFGRPSDDVYPEEVRSFPQ
jgi:FkbM family methyltransferase